MKKLGVVQGEILSPRMDSIGGIGNPYVMHDDVSSSSIRRKHIAVNHRRVCNADGFPNRVIIARCKNSWKILGRFANNVSPGLNDRGILGVILDYRLTFNGRYS